MQQAGNLTYEEKAVYYYIDQVWFQEELPNPPFYNGDKPGKPTTWFKTATAAHMMDKCGKPYDVVYTNFPGKIVYEDEWQVAAYDESEVGA